MKLSSRIWILWIAFIISVISIMAGEASSRLAVFALLLAIPFILKMVRSKAGKAFMISAFLIISLVIISSSVTEGVLVSSVEVNSTAYEQGIRQGQIITSVNGNAITSLEEYSNALEGLFTTGENVRIDITTDQGDYILFTSQPPQVTVKEVPKTGIKTGLDISGGARALVRPQQQITDAELQDLIDISSNRFNVFGIDDIKITGITDLEGNKFMMVEVAGATPSDLEALVSTQGKFEAKIANQTVFVGGEEDITNVCRFDATCAAVTSCFQVTGGYACNFAFTIYLSEAAANRHADITNQIPLDPASGGQYLSENLVLLVDDQEVDSLRISSGLKGQVTTQISIQGSGEGITQQEAFENAQDSMNHLQTILISGSLPFKLEIVKLDTVSPVLGDQFIVLILLAGAGAVLAVGLGVFIRYRKIKPTLALIFTLVAELVIILGIASLINWNLDLPSIAGIIAFIGTGVDQQIIILEEAHSRKQISLRERMKRALFIIAAAYATTVASLIPLYWAGAGLFKGFAITSIIGVTVGVLITRPAFADIIREMED